MNIQISNYKDFKFKGFKRKDGSVGVRNHIVAVPASVCASPLVTKIANASTVKVVPLNHKEGCCQIGKDYERTKRTLTGLAVNPNVGGVVVVALGCEGAPYREIVKAVADTGRPVELVHIQNAGGSKKALAEGLKAVEKVNVRLTDETIMVEAGLSDINLGLECGGSDWTSGIASNPVIGWVTEKITEAGGTVILSETTELIGAEHILAKRIKDDEIRKKLLRTVSNIEEAAKKSGVDIRGTQPTPGNIEGGLTTIEEKSLGMVHKAGNATIQDVVDYAEKPTKRGLIFMDTPGQDVESMTGMAAGGSVIMLFSTGRGSPVGFPISPTIKITGNPDTFSRMTDDIDIDAGTIIKGEESIDDVGLKTLQAICDVCEGKKTKSELNDYNEIGILKFEITL